MLCTILTKAHSLFVKTKAHPDSELTILERFLRMPKPFVKLDWRYVFLFFPGFLFVCSPSPDHWAGVRRPGVPPQDQWLWSERGEVLREVPPGRQPPRVLPPGRGLLWPAPRQPVGEPCSQSNFIYIALVLFKRTIKHCHIHRELHTQLDHNIFVAKQKMHILRIHPF